jgi:acetyltransferase-like isoleucine patch superfamily enzyme
MSKRLARKLAWQLRFGKRILAGRRSLAEAVDRRLRIARASERLQLGRRSYTYVTPRIIAHDGDPAHSVTVGAYCSIAEDVTFLVGGNHRTDWISTFPFPGSRERGHPASRGEIRIGNDVWIAMGAVVFSGVTIGDGAVIGGFAVVTRDVPPYTIVAGNPARPVRLRFSEEDVALLLRLRWWEWDPVEVERVAPLLNGGTVAELAAYAEARGAPLGA